MDKEYTFGQCLICKQTKALKNGICIDCEQTYNFANGPFKDLFNKLGMEDNNEKRV